MPTQPSGSSNRNAPTTSTGASEAGPHGWVGAHAAMRSVLVGVMVARWKRAMRLRVRLAASAAGRVLVVPAMTRGSDERPGAVGVVPECLARADLGACERRRGRGV